MPANAESVYLDSSAIVKLVVSEAESSQLELYLRDWPRRVSSSLVRVEVARAVRVHGAAAVSRARLLLSGLYLVKLDDTLLDAAADLDPPTLRGLDAIHLATARLLRDDLRLVVTYDGRFATAARALGLVVVAPGSSSYG